MNNLKNKFLILIALTSATTSIMPLTFFDDGSLVHRGGPRSDNDSNRHHHVRFWKNEHDNSHRKNKNSRDDLNYQQKSQRLEINSKIQQHRNEINDHKTKLRKLDSNKNLDEKTRRLRRTEHNKAIADLEEDIADLKEDLKNLF